SVDGQPMPSLAPMLERVTPAVVNINSKTRVRVRNPFMQDPFFQQFFGMQNAPRERIEQSLGSGVVIDASKGYVVTNNHVVDGADDISVTLHDGRTLAAKLVGTDPDTDVAVIQVPAENLTQIALADSSKVRMGDFVVAVGDPFGVGQSATGGMVSGVNRTGLGGRGFQNFIQTDAPINPGNSGGPLVDLGGKVVGINTLAAGQAEPGVQAQGIGFSIAIHTAKPVADQLVSSGQVVHPSLGIGYVPLNPAIAAQLGVNAKQGAVVLRVQPGGPAAGAGLQRGDVISQVDGQQLQGDSGLAEAINPRKPGDTVTLTVLRGGQSMQVKVTLGQLPAG
ncbi:MAG TPA: trypsin-like peptidase domain-containing protein, partial [Dehalococcoidia bacterium]|nr:trypsin-like peptidase domain-containing protein [Dehalococcoidia bacterium]